MEDSQISMQSNGRSLVWKMAQLLSRPIKLARLLKSSGNRENLSESLRSVYYRSVSEGYGVNTVDIEDIVSLEGLDIRLNSYATKPGNVSHTELLYVCLIVRTFLSAGDNFLEIGTFNGNTILNVSLNVPEESKCYTLDLPPDTAAPTSPFLTGDLRFIQSSERLALRHTETDNVEQIYSDSADFDFSSIKFSGAFIDGGHQYHIVKSDTENVLGCIQRPGFILWHDYYGYNQVSDAIHEFAASYDIVNIAGTYLCFARIPA